jgi:transcriptional regulator with XRE-family HTH domain
MGYSDPEFLKEFAAWLVVLRKRFQMTQAELGALLGVRNEAISRWEHGKLMPTALTVVRLLALAEPHERGAIMERAMTGVDDRITVERQGQPMEVACAGCGRLLQVRLFTQAGWPAPKQRRSEANAWKVTQCPNCRAR